LGASSRLPPIPPDFTQKKIFLKVSCASKKNLKIEKRLKSPIFIEEPRERFNLDPLT
jgi:hypothetical protein